MGFVFNTYNSCFTSCQKRKNTSPKCFTPSFIAYTLFDINLQPFLYCFSRSFGETRSQTNERPLCLLYFLSCLPLSSSLSIALCSSIGGEKSSGLLAVSVWSNPGQLAGVIQDLSGITNIGHSFLFVLSCYRMVIREAAHCRLYVIAKMLIATHFLKWRNHIPVWLCCVVLEAGLFCGSVAWISDKNDYCQVIEKCWYCTDVLENNKIKCWVLIQATSFVL